jgi:DNA-binding MarR family transcriptional regulator
VGNRRLQATGDRGPGMSQRFENFVGTVSNLNKEITRIKNEEMRRFGLNGTDGMCLYYLMKEPAGVTSAELARMMGVDRAVVSRSVTRLGAGDFVEIGETREGRAGRVVSLSDKGMTVMRECDEALDRIVERAGVGVDDAAREGMYAALDTILSNLRKI